MEKKKTLTVNNNNSLNAQPDLGQTHELEIEANAESWNLEFDKHFNLKDEASLPIPDLFGIFLFLSFFLFF